MTASTYPTLSQEWNTLQNNIEQYEKGALLIKLTGVVLCAAGLAFMHYPLLTGILLGVLWLQEGIFRTSQSRLVERIVRIEQLIKQDTLAESAACQLHSEWLAGRAGIIGLMKEYLASALRPTVAFPYVVLIMLAAVL